MPKTHMRADHRRETETVFFLCEEKRKIIVSGTFFCQTSHVFCQAVASGSEAISSVFLMQLPCVQFFFHRFISGSPRCDKQMSAAGHRLMIVLHYEFTLIFRYTLLVVHMATIPIIVLNFNMQQFLLQSSYVAKYSIFKPLHCVNF